MGLLSRSLSIKIMFSEEKMSIFCCQVLTEIMNNLFNTQLCNWFKSSSRFLFLSVSRSVCLSVRDCLSVCTVVFQFNREKTESRRFTCSACMAQKCLLLEKVKRVKNKINWSRKKHVSQITQKQLVFFKTVAYVNGILNKGVEVQLQTTTVKNK